MNRYYHSTADRFTQQDPIGLAGGLTLYGFAAGDPVNFSDPFGLTPCVPFCGGAGHAMIARALGALVEQAGPQVVQLGMPDWIGGPRMVAGAASRGFASFRAFKAAKGAAGVGKHWHHIVGQTPGNVERFGAEAIHTADNLIAIDAATHAKISGFYNSKAPIAGGMRVREWLASQPLEAQREFGLQVRRTFGVIR